MSAGKSIDPEQKERAAEDNAGDSSEENIEALLEEFFEQEKDNVPEKRRRIIEAFRRSEARYRNLFDNAQVGLFRTRLSDGKALECNQLMAEMLGYENIEECKEHIVASEMYADPGRRDEMLRELERKGRVRNFEVKGRHKDGSTFWMSFSAAMFKESGYLEGAVIDITDKKAAVESLRESEQNYRMLTEGLHDIVFVISSTGIVEYCSPAVREFGGYDPEEEVGKHVGKYFAKKPELLKALMLMKKVIVNKKSAQMEVMYRPKRGDPFYVEVTGKPLIRSNGRANVLCLMRDIRERKRNENLLKIQRDIGNILSSQCNLEEALSQILKAVCRLDGVECGGVYRIDKRTGEIRLVSHLNLSRNFVERVTCFDPDSSQARSARKGKPLYFNRTGKYASVSRNVSREGVLSYVLLPVKKGKETIAVLNLGSRTYHEIPESSRNALEIIAAQAGGIIARVEAEDALLESERKYRNLFESSRDAIMMLDREQIFDCNQATLDLYRYATKSDFLKKSFSDLTDSSQMKCENFRFELEKHIDSAYETGGDFFEWVHKRADGTEFNSEISMTRFELDGRDVLQVMVRDITDRKLVEQELNKFKTITDRANYGAAIMSLGGNFLYVNGCFASMHRYDADDLINKPGSILYDDLPRKRFARLMEKVRIQGGVAAEELEHKRSDGTRFTGLNNIYLIKDEENLPLYISATTIDISDKKRLQARLQRAQKMEAIGTLAGGVAHDLNNILSGLVSYPELILMDLPEESNLRQPIATIKKAGDKAAAVVQDLLTLARRNVAVTEIVNLNDIVTEYFHTPEFQKLKNTYPEIDFKLDLKEDLMNITGSPVHLSKTLMNLVTNAVEAIEGEGAVKISTDNGYVDRNLRGYDNIKEGDYAVLTVEDDGMGISDEDRDKIFEPFFTKKIMGRSGTGLGMSVVWASVKDHNGFIDLHTSVNRGTVFKLYFPTTRKEAKTESEASSIEACMGSGETVLVVDDIKEQREIAEHILKKLGYKVFTAKCGEDAVEYMRENSAELLLLDMIMDPGMDGLATYREILKLHPGQKAVIASGFSETTKVREAQKAGAGPYLRKPYSLRKLGIAIKKELERREKNPPPDVKRRVRLDAVN